VVILLSIGCGVLSKELYKDSRANYKANYVAIEERAGARADCCLIVLI